MDPQDWTSSTKPACNRLGWQLNKTMGYHVKCIFEVFIVLFLMDSFIYPSRIYPCRLGRNTLAKHFQWIGQRYMCFFILGWTIEVVSRKFVLPWYIWKALVEPRPTPCCRDSTTHTILVFTKPCFLPINQIFLVPTVKVFDLRAPSYLNTVLK
jgi:hypothetical protein